VHAFTMSIVPTVSSTIRVVKDLVLQSMRVLSVLDFFLGTVNHYKDNIALKDLQLLAKTASSPLCVVARTGASRWI
jgi:hypothetical protein